jgi:hypothetical protein
MLENRPALPGHEDVLDILSRSWPPEEKALFDLLKGGRPVLFARLFAAINKTPGIFDDRMMRSRIGPILTRLHTRVEPWGRVIVWGEPRGTCYLRWAP